MYMGANAADISPDTDCGCGGSALAGVGFNPTLDPNTTNPSGSLPWWQTAVDDIAKIIGNVTTHTPTVPTFPTTLPNYPPAPTPVLNPQPGYSTAGFFGSSTATPYLIGGAVLLAVLATRKK